MQVTYLVPQIYVRLLIKSRRSAVKFDCHLARQLSARHVCRVCHVCLARPKFMLTACLNWHSIWNWLRKVEIEIAEIWLGCFPSPPPWFPLAWLLSANLTFRIWFAIFQCRSLNLMSDWVCACLPGLQCGPGCYIWHSSNDNMDNYVHSLSVTLCPSPPFSSSLSVRI